MIRLSPSVDLSSLVVSGGYVVVVVVSVEAKVDLRTTRPQMGP